MGEIITLDNNSPEIQYLCKKDKRLAKVISIVGPITYETHDEAPYEFLVHEIIEQMLSVKAGNKIFSRLVELCNGKISPEIIDSLSIDQIKGIGTSASKANFIMGLTHSVLNAELQLNELVNCSDEEVIKRLTSLRGVGMWTAKMYLIFVLNRSDVLPTEDVAFLQSYCWMYKTEDRSTRNILNKCKKWKPYSSIAARYLYRALDAGLTKEEFHLFK